MERIKVNSIIRHSSYIETTADYTLDIPQSISQLSNGIAIIQSYYPRYTLVNIDSVDYIKTTMTTGYSNPANVTLAGIESELVNTYNRLQQELDSLQIQDYDNIILKVYDGSTWS
jgi:hypothetical protein